MAAQMVQRGTQSNSLLRFLLYSNTHIPLIALGLIGSTSVVLGLEFSWALAVLSASGAFVIYQIDRVWLPSPEDIVNQPKRVEWYRAHRIYTYVSFALALLLGAIAVFFLDTHTIWLGLCLGAVGFIYLIPLGSDHSRLKGHVWAKPLFITLCWASGGVVLPVVESGSTMGGQVWVFFLYRGLLIAANVLLSDLPDRKGDGESMLVTFAIVLPKRDLARVVVCLSLAALVVGGIHSIVFSWPGVLFIDLTGAVLMMLLAYKAYQGDVPNSHITLSYINDLVIGWPLVGASIYYLIESIR